MISVKPGGRLHTGRSRNDQCAVDLHMYVRKLLWNGRAYRRYAKGAYRNS